jgi:glutathione gamma-glutamylcysteinyltransferase
LAKLNSARSLAFSPLEPSEVAAPASIRKSSLAFFRNCLIACNRRSDTFLTVNFNRKALGQTGTGHYSPVAGYNAKRDLALILDVAKFKYDSYWCPLGDLYEALKPLDKVSLVSRGFVMNKKGFDT